MLKLLLVGDKPIKQVKGGFVGTPAHKRLQAWLKVVAPNVERIALVNCDDPGFPEHLIYGSLNGFKILAIGENAAISVQHYGITNYFKLPNPAGRLKAQAVIEILNKCKSWLEAND